MNVRACCAALGFIVLLSTASAQERRTVGIGVAINPLAMLGETDRLLFLPIGLTNFSLPVNITGNFRIEPEIGIVSISSEGNDLIDTGEETRRSLRVGTGLFYVRPLDETFSFYGGLRAGIVSLTSTSAFNASQTNGTVTTSETDFYVGPCAAGEYFFSPHFSLGAEVQVNYVHIGTPTVEGSVGATDPRRTQTVLSTNALILLRCYL